MSNLWLKTKDQELAERVKDQMPRNPDLRWYVAESGDPEFPWGLFNELVRYGDGAMAPCPECDATGNGGDGFPCPVCYGTALVEAA